MGVDSCSFAGDYTAQRSPGWVCSNFVAVPLCHCTQLRSFETASDKCLTRNACVAWIHSREPPCAFLWTNTPNSTRDEYAAVKLCSAISQRQSGTAYTMVQQLSRLRCDFI